MPKQKPNLTQEITYHENTGHETAPDTMRYVLVLTNEDKIWFPAFYDSQLNLWVDRDGWKYECDEIKLWAEMPTHPLK